MALLEVIAALHTESARGGAGPEVGERAARTALSLAGETNSAARAGALDAPADARDEPAVALVRTARQVRAHHGEAPAAWATTTSASKDPTPAAP
ncbi:MULTISPECIES: hypothetical protein [Streptomyces]|uniref:Uncharacterized protein n=2 Tax=Streptomyces TaxID=1883 RepID=A0AB39NU89_9ACTN|nr:MULTISPECIES: hypothetical protein [Streptomyces]GGQ08459.1 hypothetical protein GCM10010233_26560 [Streptomyces gancidicus]GGS58651.1 hypothetical protein GCM10010285_42570 [Streptomyces rubiginosus]